MFSLKDRFVGDRTWSWPDRGPDCLISAVTGLLGETDAVELRDLLCSRLLFELDETLRTLSGTRVLPWEVLHELRSWRLEYLACFSIEVLCKISRSSTHCATGKRCLPDRARMSARVSWDDFRASLMAILNCWIRCLVVIDSLEWVSVNISEHIVRGGNSHCVPPSWHLPKATNTKET
jgi:hypothetical protein